MSVNYYAPVPSSAGNLMGQEEHTNKKAIIVDIDGTIANIDHRRCFVESTPDQKKNWDKFFSLLMFDDVNQWCKNLIINYVNNGYNILLVSGRGEEYRKPTEVWLRGHGIPYTRLYMRPARNSKPDTEIKAEIYTKQIKNNYDVEVVVDDRARVVKTWRDLGLVCLACAEGNY